MAISDLANNIAGSVRGLGQALGLIKSHTDPGYNLFPDAGIEDIDEDVKRRWFDIPNTKYVFGIMSEDDSTAVGGEDQKFINNITSLFSDNFGGSGNFGDFALPITPQEISQTENFAVSIKPSQGGTVVQHSGNKYKDLVIAGTTGVHPFRGITGVDRINGSAILQPNELKYRSGYEVFIHFRNWIKSYHETKARGTPDDRKLRMLFKNYKDWEFLIVEPLKFTMKRDATKPLLYNYTIQFKVLGHQSIKKPVLNFLQNIDRGLEQATRAIEVSRGIFKKFEEVIRSTAGEISGVIESLRKIKLAGKAAKGIAITWDDVSTRIYNNYISERDSLLLQNKLSQTAKNLANNTRSSEASGVDLETTPEDPSAYSLTLSSQAKRPSGSAKQQFLKALATMGNAINQLTTEDFPSDAQNEILREQESAALISRIELETIRKSVTSFKNRFVDAIGFNDETIDDIFGLTSTTPDDITGEITDQQFEILYGFQQAEEALNSLLSSDEMFDVNAALYSKADSKSGANTIGEGIFSFPDPNSGYRVGVVPVMATLEDIAFVELGNSSRWTELAELNALKAPFIDDDVSSKKVNFTVKSSGFYNPVDLQVPMPATLYVVAISPTPAGAWAGKGGTIAEYLGSSPTNVANWRFITPQEGTVVLVQDRQLVLEYVNAVWIEIDLDEIQPSDVLKPGDFIKIPVNNAAKPEVDTLGPRDNALTKDLTAQERSLGVDLKLNEHGDLDLTPSGDLNVAKGTDNGAQAIVLKLLFQRGELKKHPTIGTQLRVGGKLPDPAVIRTQIMTSLLQDDRVTSVRNINLRQNNSLIEVTFDVYFRNIQEPIPITIPV